MDTAQRVAQAINVGLGFGVLLAVYFFLSHRSEDGGPTRWQRWVEWFAARYIMSRDEPVRGQFGTSSSGGSAGSGDPVLGQQNQLEPVEPEENEPGREPSFRQLEKEQLIVLLAVQRNPEGGYLYSANQITAFVGGAAAPIKATIAAVRGKRETPPPAKNLQRPANGW